MIYTTQRLSSQRDFHRLGLLPPTHKQAPTGWAVVRLDGNATIGIGWYADHYAADEEARRLTAIDRPQEWSGAPDPEDPDNYWINDETDERISARKP